MSYSGHEERCRLLGATEAAKNCRRQAPRWIASAKTSGIELRPRLGRPKPFTFTSNIDPGPPSGAVGVPLVFPGSIKGRGLLGERNMRKLLLASILVLPIAASAATTPPPFVNQPVIVTNPPNQAANVFVVNPVTPAPAGTPVRIDFIITPIGNGPNTGTPFTVPAGQTLIIENVTGMCQWSSANVEGLYVGVQGTGGFSPTPSVFLFANQQIVGEISAAVYNIQTKIPTVAGSTIVSSTLGAGGTSPGPGRDPFITCRTSVYGTLTTP